jgi:hypothetical protein
MTLYCGITALAVLFNKDRPAIYVIGKPAEQVTPVPPKPQ